MNCPICNDTCRIAVPEMSTAAVQYSRCCPAGCTDAPPSGTQDEWFALIGVFGGASLVQPWQEQQRTVLAGGGQ